MKPSDNVVSCDNHILVAKKPAGVLTQPDGSSTPDLETELKEWVKESFEKAGAVFLHAVHRLDKPVSGLVLFARTSKALSRFNEQIRAHLIHRVYLADVVGVLDRDSGVLEHYLVHGDHRAEVVSKGHNQGKLARLTYKVEKRFPDHTRVLIELETGRYHQIRAQFAAIKHPILGDARYGAKGEEGDQMIHLHCFRLSFSHPVTKENLSFEMPPSF